jgi:LysM repeat protein
MDKPQTHRIRNTTKVLMTLAGGVVIMMLGTMAIVNGFWADYFQTISHKIRPLPQTASILSGSTPKELDEKPTSSLAREGLKPQETEKVQPESIDKPGTPSPTKNPGIGKASETHASLSGSRGLKQTPASSPESPGSGRLASVPLPHGFGRMEIKDEISPHAEKKLSEPSPANFEIKPEPGEAKPSTANTGEAQESLSPALPAAATQSSPGPATPAQVSSGSKLVVQPGESLTRIVNRNYPENHKIGLSAVILANPAIIGEDTIYPGQVLSLPEINSDNQTIRLENNLFYAIYGTYRSSESLKAETTRLAKKKVHFVVRNIKDSRGIMEHRVFLGGYPTAEGLKKGFRVVETQTR